MARKGAAAQSAGSSAAINATWRGHLDSIKRFHGFPPMPKQKRDVIVLDQRDLPDDQPAAFSMRQSITLMKLTGTAVEDPIEDIVRSLPILKPSLSVARSVHEVVLLTADYMELLRLRARCGLPQDGGR